MTPDKPPSSTVPPATPVAAVAPPLRRLPLGVLALALVLGGMGLAAGLAWGAAALWPAAGVWGVGAADWVAPLAAALGVAGAALPVAALMLRLARQGQADAGVLDEAILSATGTPRALFLELAEREWARSRRYGTGAALLLVEVDRHARLLESRGTAAVDAVLAELLRQTAPTLRGADLLTRYSDAQMAVFLAQADATGALDVAERIRERAEQLEVPFYQPSHPQRLRITVSVGVAHLRPAHLNLQALIDDAEDAAAAARQAGGNCVRAAPVELSQLRLPGSWRDDHRAQPK